MSVRTVLSHECPVPLRNVSMLPMCGNSVYVHGQRHSVAQTSAAGGDGQRVAALRSPGVSCCVIATASATTKQACDTQECRGAG